jgi:hypothetical protein
LWKGIDTHIALTNRFAACITDDRQPAEVWHPRSCQQGIARTSDAADVFARQPGGVFDGLLPNRGIYCGSAREAPTAEVFTEKVTPRSAGASFQKEIVAIGLPVYAEVPKYRPEGPRTAEDAEEEEQQ